MSSSSTVVTILGTVTIGVLTEYNSELPTVNRSCQTVPQ